MYQQPHFKEDRPEVMHELMRTHPLATLVTLGPTGLTANHIPVVLHTENPDKAVLRAHVSRANPVWHETDFAVEALCVFQGTQHYITPAWYPSKAEHGKVVPTWNYIVVHTHGPLRIIEDGQWLIAHLESLTDAHEARREKPWQVSDAPDDYIERLLKGIVGIEIEITRLEGKWKLSQNRPEPDRVGVFAGLSAEPDAEAARMAGLVRV